uniref:MADF domain-containing protein n=2 Tax=Meloidogyne TaxID=189290 RepID=A0A6V7U434_MELEN|nr:unnamed protein product [Meloidogyne enterolobii]
MPWSREQRSRLIAAVKNHEILWRTSQNNRNHQQLMREALEVVHQQFEGDGFTFDEVKQQWRNLKDIFYKRYEVSLKRAQSGEQPNKVKPCWAHFDELKFLLTNQQWVDPEFKGRHRRCLAYNSIEFTDYEYSIDNEGNNNLLKIKEELKNNEEGEEEGGGSSNNLSTTNTLYNLTTTIVENKEFNIKQQNEQKYLNKRKRKNILENNDIEQNNNNLNKNQQQDRFKYFGVFVESAVRDLHQESPELARRLMQSIYSSVSAHQIEATNKKSI